MTDLTKILIVGPVPPEIGGGNPGGVAQHVWQLCKESVNHPIDLSLLATGRYFKAHQIISNIQIWGFSINIFTLIKILGFWSFHKRGLASIFTYPRRSILFLISLYRVFSVPKSYIPDLIHIHSLFNEMSFAVKLKWPDIPLVATIHSYHDCIHESSSPNQTELDWNKAIIADRKEIASMLTKIIHVSKTDALKGVKCEVITTSEILVVPNGVSFASSTNAHGINQEREKRVLFVGTFIKRKRLELLIEALTTMNANTQDPIKLTIVGAGENVTVSNAIEKHDWIDMKGYLHNDQLKDLYENHIALIVPSSSESFGIVYFEALALGCSVVGYNGVLDEFLDGIENIENKERMVIPFSPESTSKDLEFQIANLFKFSESDKCQKTRVELADYVKKTFSWSAVMQDLIIIYKQAISESKKQ